MARRYASLWFALLAVLPLLMIGCSGPAEDPWPKKPGLRGMAMFPPLYCFAANVAGDDASVLCLTTAAGPHDYSPTARDALKLARADLFFVNGLDLDEKQAEKLQKQCGNPKLKMIELGDLLMEKHKDQLLKMDLGPAHAGHGHGEYDPHIWLGIPEAVLMVEEIRDAFIAADPTHKDGYTKRAADYVARLKQLQVDGLKELQDKKDRKLISFHESLGYFARTFKLQIVSSVEAQPGVEADANHLAKLVETCKKDHVRLIAVEPQYPKETSAKTLLMEIQKKGVSDAAFVEVDPIETAPADELDPGYYEKKMRENLGNLAKAMK